MTRYFIFLVFYALLLVGCQSENLPDNNSKTSGQTILNLSVAGTRTRTHMGAMDNDAYPVYWSVGDCISVNGMCSEEADIDDKDKKKAKFVVNSAVDYPYSITYPYTSHTSGIAPKVVFPSEQTYIEGSTSIGSMPMYGYIADANDKGQLNHLAAVIRLSVKAPNEGVILKKIVIRSTEGVKISGEFSVDCLSGELAPADESLDKVTYMLPSDYTLSTSEESLFYISLPAVTTGPCVVEFVDGNGNVMTGRWATTQLRAGVVREYPCLTYSPGTTCSLPSFVEEDDTLELPYEAAISGYVRDSAGNGISGVSVSDGFSVAQTDASGRYVLFVTKDTWYVYISIPSEYEIPINEYGQPCFYQRYSSDKESYDFSLKPLSGGKESKFSLFVLTDLHISTQFRQDRFENEALPSILSHANEVKAGGLPCYGITCGDLINNSSSGGDNGAMRATVRSLLAEDRIGFPVFNVMGNHDNTYCDARNPIESDATSSTYDLKMQRDHEEVFGPVNYSFNRGDVHIIGMRNIIYTVNNANNTYEVGFTDAQWKWLQEDLSFVPKDKMIVLCTHIKMHKETENHISHVTALLGEYKEAHIFTGHSHVQRNFENSGTTKTVYEHNLGAICGASWKCKMCDDGTPIGYNVFVGDGATFGDWYFMAFNKNVDDRKIQMRLYRGNAVTGDVAPGAAGSTENQYGVKGYYKFNFDENVLLANVYNADSRWTVKVYEDGEYSGDMTHLPSIGYSMSALIGNGSYSEPFRFAEGVLTGQDMYAAGLLQGILQCYKNGAPLANCWGGNYHMYMYELKNKDAAVKVVAVDRFGNEYTETNITSGTDYTLTSGDYTTDSTIK